MAENLYLNYIDSFKSTKGYEIYSLLKAIGISFTIHTTNQFQLAAKLKIHAEESTLARISGPQNTKIREAELIEIIRLLHNYASSAMSLVDHTRRISGKVLQGKSLKTYQAEVTKRFTHDPLSRFIQDLRNYLVHYSHPPIRQVMRFSSERVEFIGIELAEKELQEWDGWKPESRDFLRTCDDKVLLLDVVIQYGVKVVKFMQWVDAHINLARKEDLDEFWRKHDEWVMYCKAQGIPTTDEEFRAEEARFSSRPIR